MTSTIPDPGEEPTISVEKAGELLGLCRASAYSAVHRGEIPVLRIGRRLLVPTAELLKMLGIGEQHKASEVSGGRR